MMVLLSPSEGGQLAAVLVGSWPSKPAGRQIGEPQIDQMVQREATTDLASLSTKPLGNGTYPTSQGLFCTGLPDPIIYIYIYTYLYTIAIQHPTLQVTTGDLLGTKHPLESRGDVLEDAAIINRYICIH